jgi:hypothetical protein
MKKQKLLLYILKWLAMIFLVYLVLKENSSKMILLVLIGFVSAILIWEGFRDFRTNSR